MEHYGILSLLPPVVAILLAIRTRQVFLSLTVGVWLGWLILDDWNFLKSFFDSIQALVDVFKDAGNTRTIMFCALVGALIVFIQKSGGVEGFILKINRLMEKIEERYPGKNAVVIPLIAWFCGVLVFVETSISSLTVGTLFRPIFDREKISREKLAWIADSSSAPASILIPFNGWGAFIMGLLAAQGFGDPFAVLFATMPYNFYPILALLIVPVFLFFKKDIGSMKNAERRIRETGKLLPDNAQPMVSDDLTAVAKKEGIAPRSRNMILPILVMVVMMPLILAFTGWQSMLETHSNAPFFTRLFYAIGQGSGSTAVLAAVLTALLFSMILYRAQGIFKTGEMMDLILKGVAGLVPLALLMMLAFAIGNVCKLLGAGSFVAEIASGVIAPGLVPLIIFLAACFIAFSTGTSWGTFAIMIPIAVPLANELGADVTITIAAALGGGVFGDHCSPISDTTIISSMSAACDHIDHVKTQLPYALLGGALSAILYLLAGFA